MNLKTFFSILAAAAAMAMVAAPLGAGAQTPVQLSTITATGSAASTTVTFTPATLIGYSYPNVVLASDIPVPTTNGMATTNLLEGPYTIAFKGYTKTMKVFVPGAWVTNYGYALPLNLADPRWQIPAGNFSTLTITGSTNSGIPVAAGFGVTSTNVNGTNVVALDQNVVRLVPVELVVTNQSSNVAFNGQTNLSDVYTKFGFRSANNLGHQFITAGTNIGGLLQNGTGSRFWPNCEEHGFNGGILASSQGFMQDFTGYTWLYSDGSVDFTKPGTSNIFSGTFIGDGSGLYNLPGSGGLNTASIVVTNFSVPTNYCAYLPVTNGAGLVMCLLFTASNNVPWPAHYTLTVTNGTGSGSYLAGASVAIGTNAPGFTNWSQAAAGLIGNTNLASTTVTMPASNVWVRANYYTNSGGPSGTPLMNITSTGSLITTAGARGTRIYCNSPLTLTALGREVFAGNVNTHAVKLTDVGGNTIAQVTVVTAGKTAGTFSYTSLGTNITLSASTFYAITSDEDGTDQYANATTTYTSSTAAVNADDAVHWDFGLVLDGSPGTTYGPVNALY